MRKRYPRKRPEALKMNTALRLKLRGPQRRKSRSATIPVIVQLKGGSGSTRIHAVRLGLGRCHFPVVRRLPLIGAVSSKVSPLGLKRLCARPDVRKVYLDGRKSVSLNIATPAIGSTAVKRRRGLTGRGVHIAILDTGLYPHPDLTRPVNRIVAFKDFVNGRKRPYDDNGHGTHIAGDAAGNGFSSCGKYAGPAPAAGIVAVKVLDEEGFGYDSDIIKGIEWCVANRKRLKLRILSLSLGGPALAPCADDPLCQAVEKAVKAGLLVTVAAGNAGPGRDTLESPGTSPAALTVGAADDRRTVTQRDDIITRFSGRGPVRRGRRGPDLVAPGESVVSLRAPGSLLDMEMPYARVGRRYFTLSGTSISTPMVAGAAAQLLQRYPGLCPKRIKHVLKRTAFSLGWSPAAQGRGEINVRFLLKRPPSPCRCRTKRPPCSCRPSLPLTRPAGLFFPPPKWKR